MCGVAGLIAWSANTDGVACIEAMIGALRHRGPDDRGRWIDAESRIAFGHARLSIIDLSPHGHQPMNSPSGRYAITYNGEIYNFSELRAELERQNGTTRWRGHSDTEVLLAAIDAWGLRRALERVVGMFAFAVWDRQQRELWLARDRMGEKPLYYGRIRAGFAFASELKALRALRPDALAIDRDSVAEFMRFGYVPAPHTIYQGIHKLPAGCLVRVGRDGTAETPEPYWKVEEGATDEQERRLAGLDDEGAVEELNAHLSLAVRQQMVSDVPLGAFLSGGVDSSLVVAMMQRASSRPVRTFTIGFSESSFDEAPFARGVARHIGTQHTELYVTPDHALAVIPKLPEIFDEPFADSSQVPTALVAQLTRESVTVSLSGDGGDELFGGYPRYQFTPRLWKRLQSIPKLARAALARVLSSMSPRRWDAVLPLVPGAIARGVSGHRLLRLSQMLDVQDFGDLYVRMISQWQPEDGVVCNAAPRSHAARVWPRSGTDIERMRRWDASIYLADDILVKVDRSAMHVGLETRAPLLDHRVVEFAFALPERFLIRDGEQKWLMKRLLDRYVPRALIDRPKSGFGLPMAAWLRGPLRDWASDLLDERSMRAEGFLDATAVARTWSEHLGRHADRQAHVWNALMFQAWLRHSRSQPTETVSNQMRNLALNV